MKKLLALATVATAAATLSGSVLAHHGHNSSFDVSKLVDVSGVITKLRFVNPHSYVYFDVTTEGGEVENWYCEMRAANVMKRSGWTADMFEAGKPIRVEGIASRKSDTGCYVETVTLGDDVVLNRYDQIEENKNEVKLDRAATTAWGDPNIAGDWAANQLLADTSEQASYLGGPPGRGGEGGRGGPPGEGEEGGRGGPPGDGEARGGRGGPPAGGRGGRGGAAKQLTEVGTAAAAALAKTATNDNVAGRLDCAPRDFFSDWTFDQHANLITQEKDKITMKYGFMDTVRTIHMNMKEHPKTIEPSFAGHSIGHWEDDVLVVDTIGFPVGATSDEYRVVEKITVDQEKGELTIAYTADDTKYWKPGQANSGQSTVYVSDLPWEPYNCEDLTEE